VIKFLLGKGSAIGDIIGWFNEEIKVMLATFAKANKYFACYAIVGVLWMLYDSGCDHLSELQTLMSLCDASLQDDLPLESTNLRVLRCFVVLCFNIHLTYVFAWFLMKTEEAEGTEGINDEEQPEGAVNDEGTSAPRDRNGNVPDTIRGHQDTAKGDRDREV
jgi:hypothetical protein